MTIFKENNGDFSWRKIMTAGALLVFMVACLGYLIKHDFDELPNSYQLIVAGVFTFYFAKNLINKAKITTNDNN